MRFRLSKTWKLLNEVINKRKIRAPFPSSFKSEGKIMTDPEEIADKFCKYFNNIGPNLAGAIRDYNSSVSSFIGDVNRVSWKAFVACFASRGRPPAMTIFQCV